MGHRRQARELALTNLYQIEFGTESEDVEGPLSLEEKTIAQEVHDYASILVHGVQSKKEHIDSLLKRHSRNWSIERMDPIDRCIMRLAILEIVEESLDVPATVIINEAVEIAKKYGSNDSKGFVNGILDSIVKEETENES
jgi:N utilization substance protein B